MEEWLINYIRDWKNAPSPKPINDETLYTIEEFKQYYTFICEVDNPREI